MNRNTRPTASTSSHSSHSGLKGHVKLSKEDEERRKNDLQRERERVEREQRLLFGDASFVTSPAPPKPSPASISPVNGHVKSPAVKIVASVEKEGEKTTKSIPASNPAVTTVTVKKSGVGGSIWPLGKPDNAPSNEKLVKKAGGGLEGSKKVGGVKIVSSAPPASANYKPPPLPQVKYVDPSKSSVLPSLADWRAGITKGFVNQEPRPSSTVKSSSSRQKSDERVVKGRREVVEEEEEEDDWIVNDESDVSSEEDEASRIARKKRRARDAKMERMWAELRQITGYNPMAAKYAQRDRSAISEASHDEITQEERKTKLLGRIEDKEEEERQKKMALLKRRRKAQWNRDHGLPSDDDLSEDDEFD